MRGAGERRVRAAASAWVLLVPLLSPLGCGLLIADNPGFVDSEEENADAASTTTGSGGSDSSETETPDPTSTTGPEDEDGAEGCEPGTLDCDDDGECESDANALETCGGCSRMCEYPDAELSCEEGECVAVLGVDAAGDVTIVENDEASGGTVRLYADTGVDRREILLAFPIPELLGYATLKALRLVVFSHNVTSPIGVFINADAWGEQTVQWPGPMTTTIMPLVEFVPSVGEVRVDFGEAGFDAAMDDWTQLEQYGLRIRSPHENTAEFDAREHVMDTAPRLELELRW